MKYRSGNGGVPAVLVMLASIASACAPGGGGGGGGDGGSTAGSAGTTGVAGSAGGAAGTTGSAGTTGAAGGVSGAAGTTGSAGTTGVAGAAAGTIGSAGTTGAAGSTGGAAATTGTGGRGGTGGATNPNLAKFSFFITSLEGMRALSGSQDGFGGNLRYGETGPGAGLRGADKICRTLAGRAMPGAEAKTWRAFLSATTDGNGSGPVHARDRVGAGPWYDAMGRTVASNMSQLLMPRPGDAHAAIKNDLPNEFGIPHHQDGVPGCTGNQCPDNHQILTGTNAQGMLYTAQPSTFTLMDNTCSDWTTSAMVGRPFCGHSWSRTGFGDSFNNWMSSFHDSGCAPCARLDEAGGVIDNLRCVGSAGGYGAIYCFALEHG